MAFLVGVVVVVWSMGYVCSRIYIITMNNHNFSKSTSKFNRFPKKFIPEYKAQHPNTTVSPSKTPKDHQLVHRKWKCCSISWSLDQGVQLGFNLSWHSNTRPSPTRPASHFHHRCQPNQQITISKGMDTTKKKDICDRNLQDLRLQLDWPTQRPQYKTVQGHTCATTPGKNQPWLDRVWKSMNKYSWQRNRTTQPIECTQELRKKLAEAGRGAHGPPGTLWPESIRWHPRPCRNRSLLRHFLTAEEL